MPTLNDDVYVGLELIPAGTDANDLPPNKLRHLTNPAIWAGGLPTFPQELTEIVFSGTPADGDTLLWSAEQGMFVTGAGSGGGGFDTTAFLAAAHTWAGKQTFGPSDGIQATISENPYQPGARQLLIGSQDFSGFASELVTSANVASLYLQNNGDAADLFAGVREGLGHSGVQLELNDYAGWTQIAADIDDISANLAIRGGATQTTPWLDLLLSGEGQSRFRIEPWNAYNDDPADPGVRMVFGDGTDDQYVLGADGYGDFFLGSFGDAASLEVVNSMQPDNPYGGTSEAALSAIDSRANVFLKGGPDRWRMQVVEGLGLSFEAWTTPGPFWNPRMTVVPDGPTTFYPPDANSEALATEGSFALYASSGGSPLDGAMNIYAEVKGAVAPARLAGLDVTLAADNAGAVIANGYGLRLREADLAPGATITHRYGIYQEDPLAKNVFLGQEADFGTSTSTIELFMSDLGQEIVTWAGAGNPYFDIWAGDGYAYLQVKGDASSDGGSAYLWADPLSVYLEMTTSSAPAASSGKGRTYVAADGSLHYRGPTTDTQLAPA